MNIYQKIERFVKEEKDRPVWVDEILYELREIKRLIKTDEKDKKNYFEFVRELKEKFKSNIKEGKDITIFFQNKSYGVNLHGFIYDKETKKELIAKKAFEIFHFLYYNKKNLSRYIK